MNKIVNVVLSGGSGTRLWPLSRASRPKQFLQLFDDKSLFQHTLVRNSNLVDEFFLITNSSQVTQAEKQANEIGFKITNKIIEPVGRNTAPAIALAALGLHDDDIMIVTPSDHMVGQDGLYKVSMDRAIELANEGFLVTFGIKPTRPNTGFGYIEYQGENVLRFTEKPNIEKATLFLEKGNFSWNSGIFCFKASVFLDELKKYNPLMLKACIEAFKTINANGEIDKDTMMRIPSDSIDYAVLEKSSKIKTVLSSFYWTDLGTFDAIIDYKEKGNTVSELQIINSNFVFGKETNIFSHKENMIVVNTEDSLVILERNNSDAIKKIYHQAMLTNTKLK